MFKFCNSKVLDFIYRLSKTDYALKHIQLIYSKLTGTGRELPVNVQNPLVISSDELSEQCAVVLDRSRRIDGP